MSAYINTREPQIVFVLTLNDGRCFAHKTWKSARLLARLLNQDGYIIGKTQAFGPMNVVRPGHESEVVAQ